jgi:hypothetical protein
MHRFFNGVRNAFYIYNAPQNLGKYIEVRNTFIIENAPSKKPGVFSEVRNAYIW